MSMEQVIRKELNENFIPCHLQIINESHQHSGHRTESHFKVVMVSDSFLGKSLLKRHQAVHACLTKELKQIHALSLKLYTTEEWQEAQVPQSPLCKGKAKKDAS